jgi:5-methylcytosine-specific restriction endonuclease McrA
MPVGRKAGEFCGETCRAYWRSHGGLPPTPRCIHCFEDIPLVRLPSRRRRGGPVRRRHHVVRVCDRCRQDLRKHGMSVKQLAARDGAQCKICFTEVDMTLRAPDPGTPSVDHKLAKSRGGGNEPENLQLAHLWCNTKKADRIYEELLAAA